MIKRPSQLIVTPNSLIFMFRLLYAMFTLSKPFIYIVRLVFNSILRFTEHGNYLTANGYYTIPLFYIKKKDLNTHKWTDSWGQKWYYRFYFNSTTRHYFLFTIALYYSFFQTVREFSIPILYENMPSRIFENIQESIFTVYIMFVSILIVFIIYSTKIKCIYNFR